MVENSFCQVVGSLRNVDDTKNLLVLHISAVNDPNMLTEHLLSIVHTNLKARTSGVPSNNSQDNNAAGSISGGAAVANFTGTGNPQQIIQQFITVRNYSDLNVPATETNYFCRRLVLTASLESIRVW